jgi:hypothetical protein
VWNAQAIASRRHCDPVAIDAVFGDDADAVTFIEEFEREGEDVRVGIVLRLVGIDGVALARTWGRIGRTCASTPSAVRRRWRRSATWPWPPATITRTRARL